MVLTTATHSNARPRGIRAHKGRRATTALCALLALTLGIVGAAAPAGAAPPPATGPLAGAKIAPWTGSATATDPSVQAVPPAAPYGEFTPVTPHRILDTRDGSGQPFRGPIGQGITRSLLVAGQGGVPLTGAIAVVMNITVDAPTAGGYLTVWPSGSPQPATSSLNFVPGQTVPNLVTVMLGTNGSVNLYNFLGDTQVIGDVMGYYSGSTGPAGSRYHATTASRIVSTRDGIGVTSGTPRTPGQVTPIDFGAGHGILGTTATAVVLNVTVTNATGNGYFSAYPAGTTPTTSNVNFVPGTVRANQVIVQVPAGGVVNIASGAAGGFGSADLIVDISGYFDGNKATDAGRFIPVTPYRAADSRLVSGLAPGEQEAVVITPLGDGTIPTSGVSAVLFNLTAVGATFGGFFSVFPADVTTLPNVSALNFGRDETVPNHVIAALSAAPNGPIPAGSFAIYNGLGSTHFVIDAFGYYT